MQKAETQYIQLGNNSGYLKPRMDTGNVINRNGYTSKQKTQNMFARKAEGQCL